MNHPTTISPLEAFRKAFGYLESLSKEGELRYPFPDKPAIAEDRANDLILQLGLPLVSELVKAEYSEYDLIIRPVPEEQSVEDEAQDDEHYAEEKAEWLQE